MYIEFDSDSYVHVGLDPIPSYAKPSPDENGCLSIDKGLPVGNQAATGFASSRFELVRISRLLNGHPDFRPTDPLIILTLQREIFGTAS